MSPPIGSSSVALLASEAPEGSMLSDALDDTGLMWTLQAEMADGTWNGGSVEGAYGGGQTYDVFGLGTPSASPDSSNGGVYGYGYQGLSGEQSGAAATSNIPTLAPINVTAQRAPDSGNLTAPDYLSTPYWNYNRIAQMLPDATNTPPPGAKTLATITVKPTADQLAEVRADRSAENAATALAIGDGALETFASSAEYAAHRYGGEFVENLGKVTPWLERTGRIAAATGAVIEGTDGIVNRNPSELGHAAVDLAVLRVTSKLGPYGIAAGLAWTAVDTGMQFYSYQGQHGWTAAGQAISDNEVRGDLQQAQNIEGYNEASPVMQRFGFPQ